MDLKDIKNGFNFITFLCRKKKTNIDLTVFDIYIQVKEKNRIK